jgi:hypothetical protein
MSAPRAAVTDRPPVPLAGSTTPLAAPVPNRAALESKAPAAPLALVRLLARQTVAEAIRSEHNPVQQEGTIP